MPKRGQGGRRLRREDRLGLPLLLERGRRRPQDGLGPGVLAGGQQCPAQRQFRIGSADVILAELLAGQLDGPFEQVPRLIRAALRHEGQAESALGVQVPD